MTDLMTPQTAGTGAETKRSGPASRVAAFLIVALCGVGAVIAFSSGRKQGSGAKGERVVSANTANLFNGASLRIASEPPGATAYVNGRLAGATPVCLEGLPPGLYGVRIEKSGCKPLARCVDLKTDSLLSEKLDVYSTGLLTVNVKPAGSEVLLDGELIGNTPLTIDKIPAGIYELLIRKTNHDSFSAKVEISPQEPQVFADFELKDKVLAMMEGMLKSEPQRLAHYIDLAHYHFINNRIDTSVDMFVQAMEVMKTPLDFNGPGYSGKEKLSAAEIELENRLREEDRSRFLRELEKHRNWPTGDTQVFRTKLDQAQELMARKNVASWIWADTAAKQALRGRNYEKAMQMYLDFINAAPNSPDLPLAYGALIEVHLMQKNTTEAQKAFETAFKLCDKDDTALRTIGAAMYPYHDRVPFRSRALILEMSERALRKALELTKDAVARAQCAFDLGNVLTYQGKAGEAVPLLQQAVDATADPLIKEERLLRLGEGLRKAGQLDKAYALFDKLSKCERASIRENAKTGRLYVEADRAKLKLK